MKSAVVIGALAIGMISGSGQPAIAQADRAGTTIQAAPSPEPSDDTLRWVLGADVIASVDSSDAGNKPNFVAQQKRISLEGGGKARITLSCQTIEEEVDTARLQVVFDIDTSADKAKEKMLIRHINGKLKIGDKSKNERMIWNPDTMKIVPHSRTVARRVYNAAIRGDTISLRALKETQFEFDLPPMNADFRTFAKSCPAVQSKRR